MALPTDAQDVKVECQLSDEANGEILVRKVGFTVEQLSAAVDHGGGNDAPSVSLALGGEAP